MSADSNTSPNPADVVLALDQEVEKRILVTIINSIAGFNMVDTDIPTYSLQENLRGILSTYAKQAVRNAL